MDKCHNNSILSQNDIEPEAFRFDALLKTEASSTGVAYISIVDAICPNDQCPAMSEGNFVHWDNGHLTDIGSKLVVNAIANDLDRLIAGVRPAYPRARARASARRR